MAHSVVRLSQVEEKPLEWLWEPYIARGKFTLIEGQPGVGKTTVTIDLVARLSRGAAMPGDEHGSGRGVRTLLLAADHTPEDVHHRLAGVGADLSRVQMLTEPLKLVDPEAVAALEEHVKNEGIELLVIDGLAAWLGRGVRWRDETQVREALRPLVAMAVRLGVAVVLVAQSLPGRGHRLWVCGIFSVALEVVADPEQVGAVLFVMRRSNIGPMREAIVARLWVASGEGELAKWFGADGREISRPMDVQKVGGVGGLAGQRERERSAG